MSHGGYKKLLPCPFCGASAFLRQCPAKGFRAAGTRITFQVGCTNRNYDECSMRPGSFDYTFPTEQAAIEAWNKRAVLSARDAEIREVLEGLSLGTKCWCPVGQILEHTPACLATRALWEKAQPEKEEK